MCVCLTLHICMLLGVTGVQWPFTHQCLKQPWKNSSHRRAIRRANRRTLPSSACILTSPAMSSVSSTIRYSHLLSCSIPDSLCRQDTFRSINILFLSSFHSEIWISCGDVAFLANCTNACFTVKCYFIICMINIMIYFLNNKMSDMMTAFIAMWSKIRFLFLLVLLSLLSVWIVEKGQQIIGKGRGSGLGKLWFKFKKSQSFFFFL